VIGVTKKPVWVGGGQGEGNETLQAWFPVKMDRPNTLGGEYTGLAKRMRFGRLREG
jgi:hypothetical protein